MRFESVHRFAPLLAVALFAACPSEPAWDPPALNVSDFTDEVYPVLLRDCGFQTCHGSQERFFQVWGPGRTRLDPSRSTALDPATDAEINTSYQRALSMVDATDRARSLLLRKSLANEAGGAGHLGADRYGRNVYRSRDDQGYLVLSRWVFKSQP